MATKAEKLKEAENFFRMLCIDLKYPEDVERRFMEIRLFSCLSVGHLFDLLLTLSMESNSTENEGIVTSILAMRHLLTKSLLELTSTDELGCSHSYDIPSFHEDGEKADT